MQRIGRPQPGASLRLWTIQPLAVWERLQTDGILHVDPTQWPHPCHWLECFDWMREQTARRVHGYSDPARYPWWAWMRPKPDLRSWPARWDAQGEHYVRLELAVEPERVLLSDFMAWHVLLNHGYLALNEVEDEEWEADLARHGVSGHGDWPLPEPLRSRLFASWERIFDLSPSDEWSRQYIQATLEELRFSDVMQVTEFTPRPAAF